LEFILAALNQRAVEFFLRKQGSPFRGGYYSRGSAVVSDLPIPKIDFTNPTQAKAHKQITALAKLTVKLESALPGLAGRRRVAALKDIAVLGADIRKEFETFWSFGGSDTSLLTAQAMHQEINKRLRVLHKEVWRHCIEARWDVPRKTPARSL